MKPSKKSVLIPCLATLLSAAALGQPAQQKAKHEAAPVAGTETGVIGVTVEQMVLVTRGWSIKKQVLGKEVVNDKNEKLGTVEDLIVNPEKSLSYAIVGVGGYLGGGKRDVAIPTNQLKIENDKLVLAGASKDVVRAMPEFRYMK
jgi:sporulation protein YlmC with PRC-barrel domain